MSQSAARLIVRSGAETGQVFHLGDHSLSIGREPINDIVLRDPEMSRRHLRIIPQGNGYLVEDLNSTNGTHVQGRRITSPTRLNHGDVIGLGDTIKLVFEVSGFADTVIQPPDEDGGFSGFPSWSEETRSAQTAPFAGSPSAQPPDSSPRDYTSGRQSPQGTMPPPPMPYTPPPPEEKPISRKRLVLGCGCLLIILVLLCAASIYWLDSTNPELLYGPLQDLLTQ